MTQKKKLRKQFKTSVVNRDNTSCVMCGYKSIAQDYSDLDAHHITDRHKFINGGYVLENGISLCSNCHIKAEQFHSTGIAYTGYSVEDLYGKIHSSYSKAIEADSKCN